MGEDTIKTTDIYFASALIAMGARLENVDRTDLRHMDFELSLPDDLSYLDENSVTVPMTFSRLERDWLNRTGVMGHMYNMAEAIKRMKSVVHSR